MFAGTGRRLGRATVACACAGSLALPTAAQAGAGEWAEPVPEPSAAETSETLSPQAQKHVLKAINDFNNGAYVDAEEEFRRTAFFAPNWRPLHFNLAVLAEAQGKLATAEQEYKVFRPHGSPDEQLVVDQRLDELGRRRKKIAGAYRRQIGLSATTMSLGVLALGGAATAFVFMARKGKQAEANEELADMLTATGDPMMQASQLRDEASDLQRDRTKLLYAGVYVGILAFALIGYSFVPLRNAIRSKRQLEGFALGPTRLRWTGGAGVQLRF